MRLFKSLYNIEELSLCLFFVIYFSGMIIGSLDFDPQARFFPMVLSVPGLIMIVLYVLRGLLPNKIRSLMTQTDDIVENVEIILHVHVDDKKKAKLEESIYRSYSIFVFTLLYIIFSYLAGFYFSTLVTVSIYFYFSRKFNRHVLIGNIVLISLLISTVYVFDMAFGYHFNRGLFFSFP